LDQRPVVLLATNVLGDSLTLGRQVFSQTMAEWIERTVQYFAQRPDAQLVIRVHPGEVLTHGPSMVDVVNSALPEIPGNIHLVGPRDKVNTYDLVDLADLGLVYTTTTGLEMALAGVPVVAAGDTHYKGKGFTQDPQTYTEYFQLLDKILTDPTKFRLNAGQVDAAWRYAYRFFFEYALPFPWRLVQLWDDVKERPVSYVLGEGLQKYAATLRSLAGEAIEW
jgi:capsule polysaccharide export protein KpsC/LpsZ